MRLTTRVAELREVTCPPACYTALYSLFVLHSLHTAHSLTTRQCHYTAITHVIRHNPHYTSLKHCINKIYITVFLTSLWQHVTKINTPHYNTSLTLDSLHITTSHCQYTHYIILTHLTTLNEYKSQSLFKVALTILTTHHYHYIKNYISLYITIYLLYISYYH